MYLRFDTIVVASPFSEGKYWYLRETLIWRSRMLPHAVQVPAGFVTDFASIPRVFWWLLPTWEGYGPAAIVHDYLYWHQPVARAVADRAMFEAMTDQKVGWVKRQIIYRTLRAAGWMTWWSNNRKRESGMIRVIPEDQFPSSPLETWEHCQRRLKPPQD